MTIPLNRISRIVIRGEWVTVLIGSFKVEEHGFTDDAGNLTHPPINELAYHFYNDNKDEYYGPLSEIQLFKLTPE